MAKNFPLEMIVEESEEEVEEWQKLPDPEQLKQFRSYAKSSHTKSLNKALLAIRRIEDVEEIKMLQGIVVREYDNLGKIYQRYFDISKFDQEREDDRICVGHWS